MVQVLTHLTFQHHRAGEAIEFYVGLIPDSRIDERVPVGEGREMIRFTLAGRPFIAADSPPVHAWDFTPAVSIFLECGFVFMPLADYGFNPRFGWVADRFGVSWQLAQ